MRWFPDTLRTRLALAMAGLALLVGLPVYLYIGHVYGQQVFRDREQALQDLAESVASVVSVNLGERLREIELLARMPLATSDTWARPIDAQTLAELQQAHPTYAWIGAADAEGKVRVATGGLLVGVSVAQRPWFSEGLDGPYLGDRHEAKLLQSLLAPAGGVTAANAVDYARAGADFLVSSAPYFAPPADVKVVIGPARRGR